MEVTQKNRRGPEWGRSGTCDCRMQHPPGKGEEQRQQAIRHTPPGGDQCLRWWVTIPPGPIAWQTTEGQEPPSGQAILPSPGPIAQPTIIGKEPPIGQATLFGSLDTMMLSTKLDEFGKDDNQIEQKFDPDREHRKTAQCMM